MISSLHGTVAHIGSDTVDVVVGGVGFTVAVTPAVARTARIGEQLHLHTSLIVREDALSLYGFADRAACALFEAELRAHGFRLEAFARRCFVNETVTLLRATRSAPRESA